MEQAALYPDESIERAHRATHPRRLRARAPDGRWRSWQRAAASAGPACPAHRERRGEPHCALCCAGLCAAFGLTLSRLMVLLEDHFPGIAFASWTSRYGRMPRPASFAARCRLRRKGWRARFSIAVSNRDTQIEMTRSPRPGLEHHLVMMEGELEITARRDEPQPEAGRLPALSVAWCQPL